MEEYIFSFYNRPHDECWMTETANEYDIKFLFNKTTPKGGLIGKLIKFSIPIIKIIGDTIERVGIKTIEDILNQKKPLKRALMDNVIDEIKWKKTKLSLSQQL